MPKRLLDRQVSLIEHLTGTRAIYGAGAPESESLRGIDPALLHIEARFSHEKRMEKIAGVFPRTFELLEAQREAFVREFIEACPPASIGRIENARQFYGFLSSRMPREPVLASYLPDLAACELACAEARAVAETSPAATGVQAAPHAAFRRRPDVVLLRCAFDVRGVLEHGAGGCTPVERDTALAVAAAPDTGEPCMVEIAPEVFELLAALDDWIDPAAHGGSPEAAALLAELAEAGLVEMRR